MPAQIEARRRGANQAQFGYWMEQGLGKTAVILADLLDMLVMDQVSGMTCLMPNYLKRNWLEEMEILGVKIPHVFVWPDLQQRDVMDLPNDKPFLLFMNFEAALASGGEFLEKLMKKRRVLFTLDEPSPLRNHSTRTAKRIFQFAQYTRYRRIAYGTPDPEGVMDWWGQLRFCGAIDGMNPYAFRNRFAEMGGYMGKQVQGRKNEEELSRIVAGCGFLALKKDWWKDAPEKIPMVRYIDMLPKQAEQYKSMEQEFYTFVKDNTQELEVYADHVIHQLQKLQQISRGFIILGEDEYVDLMPEEKNPALKMLVDVILGTRGKVIVFAFHRPAIRHLERALVRFNPAVLKGGMKTPEIEGQKFRFNHDPVCRVIICQSTVGSRGHNLLGGDDEDHCSTTIFYENTYAMEIRSQAEDRNHRYGQDHNVVYIDLVASRNDARVIKSLQQKQNLMRSLAAMVKEVK